MSESVHDARPRHPVDVDEPVGKPSRDRRRRRHLATLWVLLVAVASTAGVAAVAQPRLSINDEATHVDYAYRLSRGELVREGQRLDQVILDEWACRGFFNPDAEFPRCASEQEYDPEEFPAAGYNYNDFHPPTYYALTGVVAAAVVQATPIDSFVTAARLLGVVWIAAGLWVAYLLMVELGVSRRTASAVATVGAFIPAAWQSGAAVNNDNATLVGGAVVALVAVLASRDRAGPATCLAVAFLAVSTKTIVGIAVIAAALFLCLDALARHRAGRSYARQVLGAAAMSVTVPVVQLGWSAVQAARSIDPDYENPISGVNGLKADGVPFSQFFSEVFTLFTPSFPVSEHLDIDPSWIASWLTVVEALMAIAPLGAALALVHQPIRRRFGASVAVAAMVGVIGVTVQYWSGGRFYLPEASPRYGLVLIPLVIVCMGFLFDQRPVGHAAARMLWLAGAVVTVPPLILLL